MKSAADRKACGEAYERAQELRKDGKWRASREQLLVCARSVCSEAVATQCAQWIGELEQAQPTVTLAAQDEDGRDLTAVKVYVDGALLTSSLDGLALPVDPGKRVFVFERSKDTGPEKSEVVVVVGEGEKRRKLSMRFTGAPRQATPPAPSSTGAPPTSDVSPPPAEKPASVLARVPLAGWITGGAAVVSAGVGVGFQLAASGAKDDLDASGCKPSCAQSDVDAVAQKRLVRTIAFGGAAALAATTVVLVVLSPKPGGGATASGVKGLSVGADLGQPGFRLFGSF